MTLENQWSQQVEFKNANSIEDLLAQDSIDELTDYEAYVDEGGYSFFSYPKLGFAIGDCMETGKWSIIPLDPITGDPYALNYSDEFRRVNEEIPNDVIKLFKDGELDQVGFTPIYEDDIIKKREKPTLM